MARSGGIGADRAVRAQSLPPQLSGVSTRPAQGIYAQFTHILLVDSGEVTIEVDRFHEVTGPAAIVLPPRPQALITTGPGTSASLLGMSPAILADVVGSTAETDLLAPVASHLVVVEGIDAIAGLDLGALSERLLSEADDTAPGSLLVITAYLRLIMVEIWRRSSFEPQMIATGGDAQILQAFRRQVDLHFRSHLTVSEYADQLGISYERLHRICQRNLRRSPLKLVHQRVLREAATWLEQSGKSVEEIAHTLGFGDSSQFSHFFKKHSGLPPSLYRARSRNVSTSAGLDVASFADWP